MKFSFSGLLTDDVEPLLIPDDDDDYDLPAN